MATQLKGATENERNRAALELHNLEHRELHQQMRGECLIALLIGSSLIIMSYPCTAMGAPDWAIGLEQAINNLQNNMNNRFNQIDNSIAVLANDVASVTNDLAIVINGSAANPHHRLRRVRNADGDFPEWFPATRGKLLNLSNAEATELMQFYELVPLDIVGVPLVNRRIKAIGAFIGVRNV